MNRLGDENIATTSKDGKRKRRRHGRNRRRQKKLQCNICNPVINESVEGAQRYTPELLYEQYKDWALIDQFLEDCRRFPKSFEDPSST